MKDYFRIIVCAFFVMLAGSTCLAQPAIGTPQFGSFGGGPDVVNLGNLNVHWDIPIRNKAGRGTNFTYDVTYDSSIWYPATSGSTKNWQPVANWGWQGLTQTGSIYATYNMSYSSGTCGQYGQGSWQSWTYTNLQYWDQGGLHTFPQATGSYVSASNIPYCPPSGANPPGGPWSAGASDGSGLTVYYSMAAGAMNVSFGTRQGTAVYPPIYVNSPPSGGSSFLSVDGNGNEISMSNGTWTDTLGVTAVAVVGSAPTTTLSFLNNSGSYSTYTANYSQKNIKTNFGCSGIGEYTASNIYLLSSLSLPDGRSYTFSYEQTPGYSTYTTGRIAGVTLPTGGTIQYQYTGGNNGIECADGSTAGLTRTTPDAPSSPWTYSRSGSGYQWTTTIKAPLYSGTQDQTVIHFLTNITGANANFYEIERQMYAGSSTLLETVLTCWEVSDSNCSAITGDTGSSWPVSPG